MPRSFLNLKEDILELIVNGGVGGTYQSESTQLRRNPS
jgi:hypothetical protein